MSYSSILTSDGDQIKRAINYLRKMDASIQGQNGNGRLYSAAMAVAHGFNLPGQTAVQLLLQEFNPRCVPPWSERELQRAVADVRKKSHDKPAGHLLGESGPGRPKNCKKSDSPPDFAAKMRAALKRFSKAKEAQEQFAATLGLPVEAIRTIGCLGVEQWDSRVNGNKCFTWKFCWPEGDGSDAVTGICRRDMAGGKKTASDSRRGITLPPGWASRPGPLLITEGFSDLLALHAAGLTTICRPSKSLAAKTVADFIIRALERSGHAEVIVLADPDDSSGNGNAAEVARLLATRFPERVIRFAITPDGFKDPRAWLTAPDRDQQAWPLRGEMFLYRLDPREPPPPDPGPDDLLPNPATEDRPEVLEDEEEHRVTDEVIGHLAAGMPNLFVRDGQLVRVVKRDVPPDQPDEARLIRIETLDAPAVRDAITRHVNLVRQKTTREGETIKQAAHPARWLPASVLCRPNYPGVRVISGITEYPVMRRDGSLVTSSGYDPSSGFYLAWTGEPLQVPDVISQPDANRCARELLDTVGDFPFASDVDRAAWIAGLLTPLVRPMLDEPTPLFLVTANVRGSGKSKLLDVLSMILTSQPMRQIPYASNSAAGEDELRKKVTALLDAGESIVSLDNLRGEFGNGTIDQLLTAVHWQDRVLGASKMFAGRQGITFFGTGNNVEVVADTARRICQIRLESPLEKPEERDDCREKNLLNLVRQNRLRHLTAALMILRGYVLAGRPDMGLRPWGSFDQWSEIVRGAVVWAGLPDPGDARLSAATDADPVADNLRLLMDLLDKEYDPTRKGLTAGQVVAFSQSHFASEERDNLLFAIEMLAGRPDARSLGKALGAHRGRVIDGRCIEKMPQSHGIVRWRVRQATGPTIRPPDPEKGMKDVKEVSEVVATSDFSDDPPDMNDWRTKFRDQRLPD